MITQYVKRLYHHAIFCIDMQYTCTYSTGTNESVLPGQTSIVLL